MHNNSVIQPEWNRIKATDMFVLSGINSISELAELVKTDKTLALVI